MAKVTLDFPDDDPQRGVVTGSSLGDMTIRVDSGHVAIYANPDGLRDLARWCVALADERAPNGSHIHLDPGLDSLTSGSVSLLISRDDDHGLSAG